MRLLQFAIAFTVTALSIISASAFEQEPKPLGLEFGMSQEAVLGLGVTIDETLDSPDGVVLRVSNTPRELNGIESTLLYFGNDDELAQVVQLSKTFPNDARGSAALSRVDELTELLDRSYGDHEELRRTPSSDFLRQPDNFAYSISLNERAYLNRWENDDYMINIFISSQHEDTFFFLGYTDKDRWERVQTGVQDREADAL